ncbi:MAG: PD40 domain-containing protein, partial [Calditrichaceae bacterium]|nr:PD40 domain-containing protein [Calditrichaceae bacterium]
AYFPTFTKKGTIYFMGYAEGRWINLGIYRSEFVNGEYTKPELLPVKINSPGDVRNWMPYISSDESFLIFCSTRELPASDQGDLFISFRKKNDDWTDPLNMGETINTDRMERFSTISPDGKFLFFTRDDTIHYLEDVYWVSSRIINKLKKKAKQ